MARPVNTKETTATGPTEKAARSSDSNSATPAAVPPKSKSSTWKDTDRMTAPSARSTTTLGSAAERTAPIFRVRENTRSYHIRGASTKP